MDTHYSTHDFDQKEALQYRPGQRVELKERPGVVDLIADYDPMMVPPIWLANDPKPRYPHELNVLPKPPIGSTLFRASKRRLVGHPGRKPLVHLTTSGKH